MRTTLQKFIATALCAVVPLSVSLAPGSARADDGTENGRPIHLYATSSTGPIGKIASGIPGGNALTINGRSASAGDLVWSGDLIESRSNAVSVSLDSVGEVTLSNKTALRLATRYATFDDGANGLTLIAALARGDIAVRLIHSANAYLRISRLEYAASRGAEFSAAVRAGNASVAVRSGEVAAASEPVQRQFTIKPVGHDSNIRVPANGLRRIQVQVLEDGQPVPGVGVMFALDTSGVVIGLLGLGTLSGTTADVVTGADGIAAVQFVARNSAGSSPISATIEGTRISWTGQVTVTSKGVSRGTGWAIFALVGAGAAAGIAYALTRDKDPLQAQPPEVK